jgi:hypothetical protein
MAPRVPPSLGGHDYSCDSQCKLHTAEDDVQQVIRDHPSSSRSLGTTVLISCSAPHRGDPLPATIQHGGLFW